MAGLETILESLLQRYESDEKKGDASMRGMVAYNAAVFRDNCFCRSHCRS